MCVTQEMKGKIDLKGADSRLKLARELNPEAGNQYLPGWNRNVTWFVKSTFIVFLIYLYRNY